MAELTQGGIVAKFRTQGSGFTPGRALALLGCLHTSHVPRGKLTALPGLGNLTNTWSCRSIIRRRHAPLEALVT